MDTALSLLISVGIIAFGIWIVVAAAQAASGSSSLLVWTLMGSMAVVVGSISLFSEIRSDKAE
jgi:hypothetical protein